MENRHWTRFTALAGLATVALIVAGVATYANPQVTDSAAQINASFVGHGSKTLASIDIQLISVLTFLVFSAGMWRRLRADEGDGGVLSMIWLGSGVLLTGLVIVWQAVFGAAALLAGNQGSPETVKALVALANALDQTITLPMAGFLAAASLIILRSRSLPRWIGWLGLIAAVLSVVAVLDLTSETAAIGNLNPIASVLWLLWMAAVSISLLRAPAPNRKTRDVIAKDAMPTA